MKWKYPLRDWFLEAGGDPCWMVCRNGHLWQGTVPQPWDLNDTSLFHPSNESRRRVRSVTRCPTCRVLKEMGDKKLRGITMVCPDWEDKITAVLHANGTIEHHQPEQLAEVYSEEAVKAWRALLALMGLSQRMSERRQRKKGL